MNMRRGLFRIWVLLTVVFVVTMAAIGYGEVTRELDKKAEWDYVAEHKTPLLPIACYKARGEHGPDYQWPPNATSHYGYQNCWYELPAFRRHFPEYNNLPDATLIEKTRKESYFSTYPAAPWTMFFQFLAAALGFPLGVLFFGSAIYWAFAGFARTPKAS